MCTRFQKEKGKKDDLSMFPLCHKKQISISFINKNNTSIFSQTSLARLRKN